MATDGPNTPPPATPTPFLPLGLGIDPPAWVRRIGPVFALVAAGLGITALSLGALDSRWETVAHAQQTAESHTAAIANAKTDCAEKLRNAVDANRAEAMALRERVARLEVNSDWTMEMLRNIGRKLEVNAPPAPPPNPIPALLPPRPTAPTP